MTKHAYITFGDMTYEVLVRTHDARMTQDSVDITTFGQPESRMVIGQEVDVHISGQVVIVGPAPFSVDGFAQLQQEQRETRMRLGLRHDAPYLDVSTRLAKLLRLARRYATIKAIMKGERLCLEHEGHDDPPDR